MNINTADPISISVDLILFGVIAVIESIGFDLHEIGSSIVILMALVRFIFFLIDRYRSSGTKENKE